MIADRAPNDKQQTPLHESRRLWLWLVPLLLVAAWLTVININQDAVWADEVITFGRVGAAPYNSHNLLEVIDSAMIGSWPPLYYFVYWVWGRLAGWSIFAGRFFSLLIGLPVIALVYHLGRRMHSRRAGLYAAAALSTSTLFIFYLHELRGYSLHVLMTVIVVWLYWRSTPPGRPADQPPSRALRTALFFGTALLLYTHPMGLPIVAAIGLYHLLFGARDAYWGNIVFLMGTGGLLFLPWMLLPLLATLVVEESNTRGMPAWQVVQTSLQGFSNGLPLVLIALGFYAPVRLRTRDIGYIAFVAGVTFVLALILNLPLDYLFHVRHIIALTPLVALLVGFALADLHARTRMVIPLAIILVWALFGVYHSRDNRFISTLPRASRPLSQPSLDTTLQWIADAAGPDDAVFFQISPARSEWSNQFVLDHYLRDSDLHFAQFTTVNMFEEDEKALSYAEKVRRFVGAAPRVWTVTMPHRYDQGVVGALISEIQAREYVSCGTVYRNDEFQIDLYGHQTCE